METPREVEAVFLFADLSGFTALTEVHGDMDAARVAKRYAEIGRKVLRPGATLVKTIGDEVMIVARDVASGIGTAVDLFNAVETEPLFPTVRIGLHAGKAIAQGGDYFGAAVNMTARVAAFARTGQILCTDRVAASAAEFQDVEVRPVGPAHFKNVAQPVSIFEVVPRRPGQDGGVVDPVCRMSVRPDNAPARLTYEDAAYYFCSFACAKAFIEQPERYVQM